MRFTNEVVEYARVLSEKHTIEEGLDELSKKFPELDLDMTKMKDMADRYLLKFVQEEGIFRGEELSTIRDLVQTHSNLLDIYNSFIEKYPDKCTYKTFLAEISRLDAIQMFNKEDSASAFSLIECEYLKELLKSEAENTKLFSEFNLVFPNKYPYLVFVSMLNDVKVSMIPKKRKGRQPKSETLELISFLQSISGKHTVREFTSIVNKEERFKDIDYKRVHSLLNRCNIPYLMEAQASDETVKVNRGARGIFPAIHDDVVKAVENRTILEGLKELQEKHPKLADKMNADSLRQYANRKGIPFIKQQGRYDKEKVVEEPKVVEKPKGKRGKGRSQKTLQIMEILKELAPHHSKQECVDILNRNYNFKVNAQTVHTISKELGDIKFKIYDKFDYAMERYVRELINKGLGGMETYKKFNIMFPGKFSASAFFKCYNDLLGNLDNEDSKKEEIKVVKVAKIDKIEKPNLVIQEEKQDSAEEEIQWVEESKNDMDKYLPIINEVNTIFERKCHQLNRDGDTHVHTDELLYALEVLINYAKGKGQLVRLANDHEDILEQYRREIEHEIELQPFSDTDTYCQNKLKALAMRRREVKYVRDDIAILGPILQNINDNMAMYEKSFKALKDASNLRKNSIFIPLVDYTMIKKYDWCKNATLNNKKAYAPILKTNARIDRLNLSKGEGRRNIWTEKIDPVISNTDQVGKPNNHKISTYRVKAEFLALNGNPFVNRYYDIKATNEDLAREKGKEYFDLISASNDKAQYQITDVIKLNR